MERQHRSGRRSLKIFAVSAILIATVVVATSVYWVLYVPRVGPKVSVVSYPLELSFALDKADYSQGENISITYTLKNVGTSNASLSFADEFGYYDEEDRQYHFVCVDYAIVDSNGTEVFRWSHHSGALTYVKVLNLQPNERQSNTFRFVMKYDTFSLWGGRLPPGDYQIRGNMPPDRPAVIVDYDGNRTTIKMETPSISFTIR